jgi:hypothetical protein
MLRSVQIGLKDGGVMCREPERGESLEPGETGVTFAPHQFTPYKNMLSIERLCSAEHNSFVDTQTPIYPLADLVACYK